MEDKRSTNNQQENQILKQIKKTIKAFKIDNKIELKTN